MIHSNGKNGRILNPASKRISTAQWSFYTLNCEGLSSSAAKVLVEIDRVKKRQKKNKYKNGKFEEQTNIEEGRH